MVDVFSQNEIDALLAALSSGEMDAEELKKEETQKKVRAYDFKRAVRFSKDHIRSLTRIHENFARFLTTYFSAQLRTFVQINVVQVEQLPYDEFIRSIPKMTILNIFEAEPLEGRMVLEVHPNVAFAMLDRLLGGAGTAPTKINALTEIETIIMERIFSRAFESLQEAWKTVIDIQPRLEALETNPQFMQIVSPNETIALDFAQHENRRYDGDDQLMYSACRHRADYAAACPCITGSFRRRKREQPEEVEDVASSVSAKPSCRSCAELGTSAISIREFLRFSGRRCDHAE